MLFLVVLGTVQKQGIPDIYCALLFLKITFQCLNVQET